MVSAPISRRVAGPARSSPPCPSPLIASHTAIDPPPPNTQNGLASSTVFRLTQSLRTSCRCLKDDHRGCHQATRSADLFRPRIPPIGRQHPTYCGSRRFPAQGGGIRELRVIAV